VRISAGCCARPVHCSLCAFRMRLCARPARGGARRALAQGLAALACSRRLHRRARLASPYPDARPPARAGGRRGGGGAARRAAGAPAGRRAAACGGGCVRGRAAPGPARVHDDAPGQLGGVAGARPQGRASDRIPCAPCIGSCAGAWVCAHTRAAHACAHSAHTRAVMSASGPAQRASAPASAARPRAPAARRSAWTWRTAASRRSISHATPTACSTCWRASSHASRATGARRGPVPPTASRGRALACSARGARIPQACGAGAPRGARQGGSARRATCTPARQPSL